MDQEKILIKNKSAYSSYLSKFINYEQLPGYNYKRAYKLQRVRRLLSLLDNPQTKFSCVIISGTKGKGSTAALLGSILDSAGIKTGVYTSPHLVSLRERIRIGNRLISDKEFVKSLSFIRRKTEESGLRGLTFFEILTAACFLHFASKRVKLAVLEVGLGGRLDATNTAQPLVCGITPISYDHAHLLGKTIKKISKEKCGIIKRGCFVISAPQLKEARRVITRACLKNKARLLLVGEDITCKNIKISRRGVSFDARTPYGVYRGLNTPLIGRHQAINAITAIGMAELLKHEFGFDIRKEDIRGGLKKGRCHGRFHIASKKPYIVLDGAQNRVSAESLRETVHSVFSGRRIFLLLGISSDKDIGKIGRILCPLAGSVIFTRANSPRATHPHILAQKLGKFCKSHYVARDIDDAITFAKGFAKKEDTILIAGSLFLVGDAMKNLKTKLR
jgi:dihydrofolate synthase/folylpolyglutamate synthase